MLTITDNCPHIHKPSVASIYGSIKRIHERREKRKQQQSEGYHANEGELEIKEGMKKGSEGRTIYLKLYMSITILLQKIITILTATIRTLPSVI